MAELGVAVTQAPPENEKWSLRGVHVEFNLLFAKVKLLFAKKPIPQELPLADLKRVESTVKSQVARIERMSALPPRRKPRKKSSKKGSRPRRSVPTVRSTTIIQYVPIVPPAPPRDVVRQTVTDLAAKARKRAVREGDVVAALAAAYIENEASKPPKEPDFQVRW
jgi:hypothetical protein